MKLQNNRRGLQIVFMLLLSVQVSANPVIDESVSTFLNNEANRHIENKNLAAAQKSYLQSLVYNRDSLTARLNIALTFELMGDRDKAEREYASIIEDPNFKNQPDMFYAYFNWAKILGDLKRNDEALQAYQKALSFRPDSIEVKTNIELLLQERSGRGGDDKDPNKDQNQDQQSTSPQDQPSQPKEPKEDQQKSQPQSLDEKDIQKIFEELKNQEQKIRELEYGEGVKQNSRGKDW